MSVSQLTQDPNPDGTCRACRSPVNPETWLCVRCGAAHGERNRCPHCRVIARTLPHPTLLHRCSVCGKPRLSPSAVMAPLAEVSRAELLRAGHAERNATVLTWVAYGLFTAGFFSLLFAALFLWVWSPGFVTVLIGMLMALVPWLLAVYCRVVAQTSRNRRDSSIESAYAEQVLSALRVTGRDETAATIAGWLSLPLERTERLLARLNSDDRMTSTVTDDGEIVYGATGPVRTRIDTPRMVEDGELPAAGAMRIDAGSASAERQSAEREDASAIVEAEFDELQRDPQKRQNRT